MKPDKMKKMTKKVTKKLSKKVAKHNIKKITATFLTAILLALSILLVSCSSDQPDAKNNLTNSSEGTETDTDKIDTNEKASENHDETYGKVLEDNETKEVQTTLADDNSSENNSSENISEELNAEETENLSGTDNQKEISEKYLSETPSNEGICKKVALRWNGCDKIDHSWEKMDLSLLNGGRWELNSFWFYIDCENNTRYYLENTLKMPANQTSETRIDLTDRPEDCTEIKKIYVYPEAPSEGETGELTICKNNPVGSFIPESDCKDTVRSN